MLPLEHAVKKALFENIGLKPDASFLVAISGGADSVSLLNILASLRPAINCTLMAAYIDHGLRPAETPAEWSLVKSLADKLGIPSKKVNVDVAAYASHKRLSIEHAARILRYNALHSLANEHNLDWIAVAHTADDQAEEILLRLMRGGGRKALAGMSMQSDTILRPLLNLTKEQLLSYLHDKDIQYCHDSSNDDLRFLRNRIRLHLLPILTKDYDPGIRGALLKTAANLREDEDLLADLTEGAWLEMVVPPGSDTVDISRDQIWYLKKHAFLQLHPALQRRLMERLLYTLQGQASYEQVLALVNLASHGQAGHELHLQKGLRAVMEKEQIGFFYPWGKTANRCPFKHGTTKS